jgi:hypothetical protein
MKKLLIIAAFTGLMASCRDTVDKPQPPDPKPTAFVVFDNSQGVATASVYDDYRRRETDKIAEVRAGLVSAKTERAPGGAVPFYFEYKVTIKGVDNFSLSYVPEIGKDQKLARIDADATTVIKIPPLSGALPSADALLSNKSFLFIRNNSFYSFELHRGNSPLSPENIASSLVNDGETARYALDPGAANNFSLRAGGRPCPFPDPPAVFEAGHIYSFDFDGNITLASDIEIKLENVNGITVPQTPDAPFVVNSNGRIELRWSAVEGAASYEVWVSTVNDTGSATKHGDYAAPLLSASLSGLENGAVYYIWLKARNSLGASGLSPVATGKPSASTVKPPDPETAPLVTAGDGRLNVSWEAVEDTDAYEIWAGVTNNGQTAVKQGGDFTGLDAVISGLENGVTYYVWVRAKNIIGASGLSPSASGKPLGTPGTPVIRAGYRQLTVTWAAVAGADMYEVYYGAGSPATLSATTSAATAVIGRLTGGATYYVRLRAKNTNGASDYGPGASGMPDTFTPGLYRGGVKIGNQNLANSLSYISANAVSGDEYYIVLSANEIIAPASLNYSGKNVGVTLLGYSSERTISLSANGRMFTVNSGVTLAIDENVTLVGRSYNSTYLVYVDKGSFVMNDGAKITGDTASYSASGVFVGDSGNFTMNGGEISGNKGGVYVGNNGTFTMNGGEISGNTASSGTGGGVCVSYYGTFTMNGGEISGNKASSGGGVYVRTGAFTMNGGEISGNSASFNGGGVTVDGQFTMNGGEISGNYTSSGGGG